MQLPVMPPVRPMLAKLIAAIPPDQLYEPKWDGFRTIVFRDGDEIELGSRNERPLTRYFPEVVSALADAVPPRVVLDGEIVVADRERGALDFEALQLRLHPAASRVRALAEQTPAELVVFDILALGDDDLTGRPLVERRAILEEVLADAHGPVYLTPMTRDAALAQDWFETYEGAGLDGIIAKRPDLTYQPDKRVMSKVKHVRTADCVVAGYRPHAKDPDAVGSLMLGLYRDDGTLASVGVVGALPMTVRRALVDELAPLVTDLDGHPWDWAAHVPDAGPESPRKGRTYGSRWNGGKDLSFVPLRPERVLEVRYDYLEGERFRHTAQLERWRPDRDPASCTYAQLERPVAYDLGEILR